MKKHTIYDTRTGAIEKIIIGQVEAEAVAPMDAVEGEYDADHFYINNGRAVQREDYTLDALPLPCKITIEGVVYHCHEQPEFVFDAPGTYKIKVYAGAAYLEKEFEIDYQP